MRQFGEGSCQVQALDHLAERSADLGNGPAAGGEQGEVLSPAAAALRRRIADARSDEAFRFEPIESDIDGADRELSPGTCLDFAPDGRAIGICAEPDEREQDDLFKLADSEPRSDLGDMFHIMKHIRRGGAEKGWPAFAKQSLRSWLRRGATIA